MFYLWCLLLCLQCLCSGLPAPQVLNLQVVPGGSVVLPCGGLAYRDQDRDGRVVWELWKRDPLMFLLEEEVVAPRPPHERLQLPSQDQFWEGNWSVTLTDVGLSDQDDYWCLLDDQIISWVHLHVDDPDETSGQETWSTAGLWSGDGPSETPLPVLEESTAVPGESTAVPGESTAVPGESTAVPEESTAVPEESTAVPEESTAVPEESTAVPEESTAVPGESTTVPEESTAVPEESTAVPEESTAVPEESTAVPEESTAVPGESTTVPEESTAVPGESTAVPGESTAVPGESTTVPEESTAVLEESTAVPAESTAVPEESTAVPAESTAVPEESTPVLAESTAVPEESTAVPEESTAVLEESPQPTQGQLQAATEVPPVEEEEEMTSPPDDVSTESERVDSFEDQNPSFPVRGPQEVTSDPPEFPWILVGLPGGVLLVTSLVLGTLRALGHI
ncbi:zonadhesin-like isoform X1 [Cololabis saira]|uniref:zonadhesin-like isoform X1 n=1 Tax=Cololabis saira TaxID=129043 RepID=UPI002AD21FB0|nr:zonadhesin-like isoform X1 [Cololabis saira]